MKECTKVIILISFLTIFAIWVGYKLRIEVNAQKDLVSAVDATYNQAISGEAITVEQTWEIEKMYKRSRSLGGMASSDQDEIDRKINTIADACPISNNPDDPVPFRPITPELRNDEPAGPWAGPTD